MSSESPTPLVRDVVVIGDEWPAAVVAAAFGARATYLSLPSRAAGLDVLVHVGNGECRENARLVCGDEMSASLWEISQASFARAKSFAILEGRLSWIASGDRETDLLRKSAEKVAGGRWEDDRLTEPALLLDTPKIMASVPFTLVDKIVRIEKTGSLQNRVVYLRGEIEASVEAPIVIVVSDEKVPALLPSFADKWIPVTLTSILHPARKDLPFLGALFHLGADCAVLGANHLRLGSYRNLYEDKAAGVHDTADPATLKGVSAFFGGLGWVGAGEPSIRLTVEALSCDGLPVVGSLAHLPGVYAVGAFAARTQNFIFEVAQQLAVGIVKGQGFTGLNIFSTKRFL